MKRGLLMRVMGVMLMLASVEKVQAQFDIIGGIIKRVIMAIDLRIQRQQTKTILLQDAQKQLENIMQKTRLADISDWVQQQKDLYEEYYQELWEVKDVLKYYSSVKSMIEKQARLIKSYQQAYATLTRDGHFSAEELDHIRAVYQGILRQSVSTVDQLNTLINAFITQMDDGDRLRIINDLSEDIDRNYHQLQSFTQENILLSLQRARDGKDLIMIKSMYGIH